MVYLSLISLLFLTLLFPFIGEAQVSALANRNLETLVFDSSRNLKITIGAAGATLDVNVKQINGITPLMGNGVTGTGSQRVTVASDNTPFPVKIDQTTPGTTNNVSIITGQNGIAGGTGVDGATVPRVSLATNVALPSGSNILGRMGTDRSEERRVGKECRL